VADELEEIRSELSHHLYPATDPCKGRGREWPCDVAEAFGEIGSLPFRLRRAADWWKDDRTSSDLVTLLRKAADHIEALEDHHASIDTWPVPAVRAANIVKELAWTGPPRDDFGCCSFCDGTPGPGAALPPERHEPDCPWRRAIEWNDANA
jgi:hypothetical protein